MNGVVQADLFEEAPERAPLVIADGVGVNSQALLILLHEAGVRPDLILFADTGDEKDETYGYPVNQQAWKAWVEQPDVHEELQAAYSRLAAYGDEISLLLDVHARRLYCGALMVIERLVVKRYHDRCKRIGTERARIL